MDSAFIRSELKSTQDFFTRPARILRAYVPRYLRSDLIAGLTIAVILLPQAMAYALIAGLPPQMGLYAAIVGAIVGALWGSSDHLQTGPTNAASLLVLSILIVITVPGTPEYLVAAGMLTLLVGLFRLGFGLARLGVLVNFISDSVIIGFTAGAGLLIFFNQLRNLLRLNVPSTPHLTDTLRNLATHIPATHWFSLAIGSVTIFIIVLLRKVNPRLPGALIAIVVAAVITGGFNLEDLGVNVIGEIPRGLPPITTLPVINLSLISQLTPGALAIAAIGLVEAISISRTIASHTRQRLDSNQEFVGQGLANIACAFLSGYTCSGSFTRSAVNYQSGAKTPMSNVFSGLFVLVAILAFGTLAAYIPLSALAGVVIVVAWDLIDRVEIARIWRSAHGDRVIMVATFSATLLLPLQFAVLTGILMSLAYYLLQTSTPLVRTVTPDENFEYLVQQPDKPACPQLGVIEILGDMYFGAVHHIEECILDNSLQHPDQRFLLLRMFSVEQCDISGIHALEGVVQAYRERGGDVFISRYRQPVLNIMEATGFCDEIGTDHFLGRDQDAIGHLFYRVLDPAICIYECPVRVFKECQNLPKRLDLAGAYPYLEGADGKPNFISPSDLWQALHSKNPPLLVDVREPREFRTGHIQQANSVPLPALFDDPSQLSGDEQVILICRSGRRSTRAAYALRDQGIKNLMVLQGGMLAWEAANLLEAIDD